MSCGFNLGCHIWGVIEPFWFWAQVGFWVVIAAGGLWALSKVKDIAGWPGVGAVAGFAIYVFGFMRGRRGESFNPIENLDPDSPDAAPPSNMQKVHKANRRIIRRTAKRTSGERRYDADKNEWVEK